MSKIYKDLREKIENNIAGGSNKDSYTNGYRYDKPSYDNYRNSPAWAMDPEEKLHTLKKVHDGIEQVRIFDDAHARKIEKKIAEVMNKADDGEYKHFTVDRTPLRNKYFFGIGYTYGSQLANKGPGQERVFPDGCIDEIPEWIYKLVIKPIVKAKLVPSDWINSAAINYYLPGGCIVSHIDPIHIFERPILTANFLSRSALSFGSRFTFKPLRVSEPILALPLERGVVTHLSGYAADEITHCVRPQDVTSPRAVIILRRVKVDAPVLSLSELEDLLRWQEPEHYSHILRSILSDAKTGNHHAETRRSKRKRRHSDSDCDSDCKQSRKRTKKSKSSSTKSSNKKHKS